MTRPVLRIRFIELGALLLILGIGAAIMLPALSRSREASCRASCQNNLKQLGIVTKMYASESKGDVYPPMSPIPENWMFDLDKVYPEYLSDLSILVCPSSPFSTPPPFVLRGNIEHPGAAIGVPHPDCVSSLFYVYTNHAILSDEQAVAVFGAYHEVPTEVFNSMDLDLNVPVWDESPWAHNDSPPWMGGGQAAIPIMWDRVPLAVEDFAHVPMGGNVLHMDGHVEFVKYSYYNNSSYFPMTAVSGETFGSVLPQLSRDCYGW